MLRVNEIPTTTDPEARLLLRAAYKVAYQLSEDPGTKTGAIIVNRILGEDYRIQPGGMILAQGYNHFRPDTPEHVKNTPEKYPWITHAEEHAEQQTHDKGIDTTGYLMVMPWWPCEERCAPAIERGGLSLLCHKQLLERSPERWQKNLDAVIDRFNKNGVRYVAYDGRVAGVEHLFNKEIWYP